MHVPEPRCERALRPLAAIALIAVLCGLDILLKSCLPAHAVPRDDRPPLGNISLMYEMASKSSRSKASCGLAAGVAASVCDSRTCGTSSHVSSVREL